MYLLPRWSAAGVDVLVEGFFAAEDVVVVLGEAVGLVADLLQQTQRRVVSRQPDHRVCLYTMTADSDFIVDRHPTCDRLTIAAGFGGHGFKFAPIIGEILAELSLTGATNHPISRFNRS